MTDAETIAALKARVKELEEENQWRPIDENTPRDGTEMLLLFSALPMYGVEYPTPLAGWWHSSAKEIDDGWETPFGFVGEPTAWRPLPAPPREMKGE